MQYRHHLLTLSKGGGGGVQADTTIYFVVWWVLFECSSFDHFPINVVSRLFVDLTRLQPLSTLPIDAHIRKIGTAALYHVLATLGCQMKHELLLNKVQSLLSRNVSVAAGKPCKNTFYFAFSCLYLKNELGDPHFLFLKSCTKGMMKISAKF